MSLMRIPVWILAWLACVGAGIMLRPPLPVDETRYLAVAWEMWLRGDQLVPYLNGVPYHHKPPLLFWLMQAGWTVFGVNEWWPRLVAPLFALAALWLTGGLARQLWPDDRAAAGMAPLVLVGCLFWAIFQTLTMFDMMLATCALLGMLGIVKAWRHGGLGGWALTALAIGVGVLAKGPAILLHILPVALAAPWWGPKLPQGPVQPLVKWRTWYLRLLLAVLAGAAIALCWAIPAGVRGGEEYRNMIFWGQSAGRIVESFDHARPVWWYLVLLPPLLMPWLAWPRLWRKVIARAVPFDGAIALLVAWIVPALAIFSIISGKQLHYLLPEFAAFALLMARPLAAGGDQPGWRLDGVIVAAFFALLGLVTVTLTYLPLPISEPVWFDRLHTGWGALLFLAAAGCFVLAKGRAVAGAAALSLSVAALVMVVHLVAREPLRIAYDLEPIAKYLKTLEDAGRPLGNFGTYHGQYQFLGRLTKPVAELGTDEKATRAFVEQHPDGVIVAYYEIDKPRTHPDDVMPIATFRFRDFQVVLWRAGLLQKYPYLANRS